tara:strand:+ start:164 stop:442 length:279 start_codon:yes stop_codon:yes gene_type:complete
MDNVFHQLGDDWRITIIPRNYVLQRREVYKPDPFGRESRAGQDKWQIVGYWSRISLLIDAFPDELALAHGGDMKSIISSMESVRKAITEAVS